jgi:hypothetical protein
LHSPEKNKIDIILLSKDETIIRRFYEYAKNCFQAKIFLNKDNILPIGDYKEYDATF